MEYIRLSTIVVGLLALAFPLRPASGQSNFYDGKTVTVLIGAKTGSLEIAAQIVAHHLRSEERRVGKECRL